jgi:Glutathione S-transferase, C-terminal domain
MILSFGNPVRFYYISSNITILKINFGVRMRMNNLILPNGCFIKFLDLVLISDKHFGISSLLNLFRFSFFHADKIPSAIERYVNETKRVLSVLESQLKKPESKGYLAAGKYTIADLSFISWTTSAGKLPIALSDYPAVDKWFADISNRPATLKGFVGGPYEKKAE